MLTFSGCQTMRSIPVLGPRFPPQKPSVTHKGTTSSRFGHMPPVVKHVRRDWNIQLRLRLPATLDFGEILSLSPGSKQIQAPEILSENETGAACRSKHLYQYIQTKGRLSMPTRSLTLTCTVWVCLVTAPIPKKISLSAVQPHQKCNTFCSALAKASRQRGGYVKCFPCLQLRGGMPTVRVGSGHHVLEVDEIPEIEMLKASLDPKKYPPLEPEYGEDGDMIVPPPMSLENFGTVHRLIDESGRLLTSREAEKEGATQFAKKPKGRNSLEKRCTCGNKMPCDGNVMITKNEHGKLEYHKIPRYYVGPAHAWECRQPAQYMVTPSTTNMTELFGHCTPLALYLGADVLGVAPEEAQSWADPATVNATLLQPCHFCEDPNHRYYMCPSLQDDDEETLQTLRRRRLELEAQLETDGLSKVQRASVESELRECVTRTELNDLYAPIEIEFRNKTYYKNMPGSNWARGECTYEDVLLANEERPDIPEDDTILMPEQIDDLPRTLRHWPGNRTISVGPGRHQWFGHAVLKCPNWHPRASIDDVTHAMHVKARELPEEEEEEEDGMADVWQMVKATQPQATFEVYGGLRPRFWHEVRSVGGPGGTEVLERRWKLQNRALMLGRWQAQPDTTGSFSHVSCYHRAWGHPEAHAGELMHEYEEEGNEIGERFRPSTFTEDLFLVMHGPWTFEHCDLLTEDAVPLHLVEDAAVVADGCLVGAPGFIVHNSTHLEAACDDDTAYVGVEAQDRSQFVITNSTIQLTQVAGVRVTGDACVEMEGCALLHTGCMGGAGLVLEQYGHVAVERSIFRPGGSLSPIWNITSAVEVDVTARAGGALLLRECKVQGRMWGTLHRPRRCVMEDVTVATEELFTGEGTQYLDGKTQALAAGQQDPVQIWADSRYECWHPRKRLEEIGVYEADLPVDGNGLFRHLLADDLESESDAADAEVVLNSTKHVTLQEWGWEGTLEDVFETESVMALNHGLWEPREDVAEQIEEGGRLALKQERVLRAGERRVLVRELLQLSDASPKVKLQAARTVAATADQGDLAAMFWLERQLANGQNKRVRTECERALKQLQVTDDEIEDVKSQLQAITLDDEGSPTNQTIVVSNHEILVEAMPPAIRAALCPTWPLYPQHNARNPLPTESSVSAVTPRRDPLDDDSMDDGEVAAQGGSGDAGAHEFTANKTTTTVRRLRLDKLPEDSKQLNFADKVDLARAGFIPFPGEEELREEIRNRRVDDWWRIMSDPSHEEMAVSLLREYAESFGIKVKAASEALRERKKLEKELSLTEDYLTALQMSTQLHLTELDWRSLYPHIDSERLSEPASERRIDETSRRVGTLHQRLADVRDEERFALLEALYPIAKEAEAAFDADNSTKIMELTKRRRKGYGTISAFADGLVEFPFRVSPDGARLIHDPKDPMAFYR